MTARVRPAPGGPAEHTPAITVLGRDAILGCADMRTVSVPVPEWGGTVVLRSMTGAERDAFDIAVLDARVEGAAPNVRAALVAACAVDTAGALLFTMVDVARLGAKNGRALDRLYEAADDLNMLSRHAQKAAEKN